MCPPRNGPGDSAIRVLSLPHQREDQRFAIPQPGCYQSSNSPSGNVRHRWAIGRVWDVSPMLGSVDASDRSGGCNGERAAKPSLDCR